jgi:hypothetical protein
VSSPWRPSKIHEDEWRRMIEGKEVMSILSSINSYGHPCLWKKTRKPSMNLTITKTISHETSAHVRKYK